MQHQLPTQQEPQELVPSMKPLLGPAGTRNFANPSTGLVISLHHCQMVCVAQQEPTSSTKLWLGPTGAHAFAKPSARPNRSLHHQQTFCWAQQKPEQLVLVSFLLTFCRHHHNYLAVPPPHCSLGPSAEFLDDVHDREQVLPSC